MKTNKRQLLQAAPERASVKGRRVPGRSDPSVRQWILFESSIKQRREQLRHFLILFPTSFLCVSTISAEDYEAALWMLREKLLKESRYSRLGLAGHEIEAMAARAVDEPLPTSVKSRNRELEKRLRIALDDRAAVLACVQRPPKVGLVTIHKLPTRRDRKELGYDYKRDKSSKPIPFS